MEDPNYRITVRIASFDIGKKNFAQYIEDVDVGTILELKEEYNSLPKSLQRRVKGPMNPKIENIIEKLYLSGSRVQNGVYDLRYNDSTKLDIQTRINLLNHLNNFKEIWDSCDYFIIEQQYFKTWSGRGKRSAGTEANVDAIKMAECVLMWFLSNYSDRSIEYFGSQNKTQILGAPYKMTKTQRKKWAETKSREIYEARGDYGMIELFSLQDRIFRKRLTSEEKIKFFIDSYPKNCPEDCLVLADRLVRERQKLDDIGDACVQCQAFKFRNMVACF